MNSSRDSEDSANDKKIREMAQKYGALFSSSAYLLRGMKNSNYKSDELAVSRLLDSTEFSNLLGRIKQELDKDGAETIRGSRIQRKYSDMVSDIVASICISDEIGEAYEVGGAHKSLFDLGIEVANALVGDPRQARKAVSLINKIAMNSFAVSEIIKSKGGFLPEEDILSQLAVEFYEKLKKEISNGGNGYKGFISSCFKIVEGNNIGYNIALLSKSDIINGLADDRMAINRLLGLHYFISGIERW